VPERRGSGGEKIYEALPIQNCAKLGGQKSNLFLIWLLSQLGIKKNVGDM
jgi:hypothetical protein